MTITDRKLIARRLIDAKRLVVKVGSALLVDARTGSAVDPMLVDPATGRPINTPDYALIAGPAAGEGPRDP